MELIFLLVIVIAAALIYDQYFAKDNDALDRFGKPKYKGSQRSGIKHPGRSSSQIIRKHRGSRAV